MEENKEDSIGKKLDLADSWLTKFGIILKKHWGKLLFLLFCWIVYWAFNLPPLPKEEAPVSSIEEFMEKCDVSTAKSAVEFWWCTSPNPVSGTKAAPQEAIKAAEDLRKLTFTDEFITAIKEHGSEVEYMVMYAIYDHFYSEGHDDITPGHRKGSIFAGGFHLDLFKAIATGNKIKRTW